jgi:hypothetical protein
MDKLTRVHRIMLGRTFTIAMILVNLCVVVPITIQEIHDIMIQGGQAAHSFQGEELLHAFPGQGPIGVILVALGVVLEGRHTFVRKVLKLYQIDELPGQEAFCDDCELFGFYLLVLGLGIECFSELIKFLSVRSQLALYTFGGTSILLNTIAILLLVQLAVRVAQIDLTEKPRPAGSEVKPS